MWSAVATWPFSLQLVEKAGEILSKGGDAVDAAEAGIHLVESDPEVDTVGRGGWLNSAGELELDAGIMNGTTLRIGSVCAVKGFEHPITIARAVMEKCFHNVLVAEGAAKFAEKMGIKPSDMDYLITAHAREEYEKNLESGAYNGHDTVGTVVLDQSGTVVAATSTSGAGNKIPGRVGDSPLVGSGFYALSSVGGAVATGLGEDLMRTCCSFRAVALMEAGLSPKEAAEKVVLTATDAIIKSGNVPDCMAVVCLNAKGEVGAACNHQDFTFTYMREGEESHSVNVIPVIDIGALPREV